MAELTDEQIKLLAIAHPARTNNRRMQPVNEIEGEIWKHIPKTNETYSISNLGRVKKELLLKSGKFVTGLLTAVDTNGKLSVGITLRPGYTVKTYVGRLVLMTFAPTPGQEKMYVQYHDGDFKNCKLDNLKWSTKFAADKSLYEIGKRGRKLKTKPFLNKLGKVKYKQVQFSEKDYEQIKKMYNAGINQNKISEIMKCSQTFISNIITGKIK